MPSPPTRASIRAVRRLALARQHLTGKRPARATPERIVATIRDLPYVQWDPVNVVAPSHLLSLWARIGSFRISDLDGLLWKERRLLQHWIPFASIVDTADYPLYASYMRRYPDSLSGSWGAQRRAARAFLSKHVELRTKVLADLSRGALLLNQFRDHASTKRVGGEWGPSSAVSEMLWHLLMSGEVMVVGHDRTQNLWGLSDAYLPSRVSRKELSAEEGEREAALRALKGLGVATARDIQRYFVRGCYGDIDTTLDGLVGEGRIHPVIVEGLPFKEKRFIRSEHIDLLAKLDNDGFTPRVAILPPFDNLVYDQARGRRMFQFDYVREQFLPKKKRRYGMWVLPIVRGEEFVGRMDARLDKKEHLLRVNAVFAEATAPTAPGIGSEIREELDRLAAFLGADATTFTSTVPTPWKAALS